MNSMCFLQNRPLNMNSLVCLAEPNPDGGKPLRCHWFVRFRVDAGNMYFDLEGVRFGERFLWQVDKDAAFYIKQGLGIGGSHPLCGGLASTDDAFYPPHWEHRGCRRVTSVPCYCDRLFAMAVRPSTGLALPVAMPPAGAVRNQRRRPPSDLPGLGRDVETLVVSRVFRDLACGSLSDLRQLLRLREVNLSFRDASETVVRRLLSDLWARVCRAHATLELEDVQAARNLAIEMRIDTLMAVCESPAESAVRCLTRLRMNRPPVAKDADDKLGGGRVLSSVLQFPEETTSPAA
tara:strand:- start:9 stop:884 length:876 start_codon:yes stop_codon:yes gene_type:complete